MIKLYVGTFVFKREDRYVALVQKDTKGKLPFLDGKWNGIGGKVEPGESPVGAAMRELREEAGIVVEKDNMVIVEHQRFDILTPNEHHIYWYATRVSDHVDLPPANDVGEALKWVPTHWVGGAIGHILCPNLDYLIPKATVFLRTDRLARPS